MDCIVIQFSRHRFIVWTWLNSRSSCFSHIIATFRYTYPNDNNTKQRAKNETMKTTAAAATAAAGATPNLVCNAHYTVHTLNEHTTTTTTKQQWHYLSAPFRKKIVVFCHQCYYRRFYWCCVLSVLLLSPSFVLNPSCYNKTVSF